MRRRVKAAPKQAKLLLPQDEESVVPLTNSLSKPQDTLLFRDSRIISDKPFSSAVPWFTATPCLSENLLRDDEKRSHFGPFCGSQVAASSSPLCSLWKQLKHISSKIINPTQ